MPTLHELLEDRNKYPDDTKVLMAEGVEIPLGDIRAGYMKDADYRKKTSEVAAHRRQLEAERVSFEQARQEAEAQLTELAKQAITNRAEPPKKDDLATLLENDPAAQALAARIEGLAQNLNSLTEKAGKIEETQHLHAQTYMADQHRRVLSALKSKDPTLDEGELVEYAKQNYIPRLDLAYKAMAFDRVVEEATTKALEEGRQKGIEEGKAQITTTPPLPLRRTAPEPLPEAPKTFEAAAEAALRDPEVLQHLQGL